MGRCVKVAIIGSGPSGFYAAESLTKHAADVQVDIIERLPSPYGLIRGGVAPDHQTTKRVARSYERTALKPQVRFYGNIEVGRDIGLEEIRDMYDAVVLAVGAPLDRGLGIPGDDKEGVYGASAFVGWYNGHPDFRDLSPRLDGQNVVVIGNGNVAVDIARVLVKTPQEMAGTDLVGYAASAIEASPVTDVHMLGRRGPVEAKFTNVELREMGRLEDCAPVVDPAQLPAAIEGEFSDRDRRVQERNLATLHEFTRADATGRNKRVYFSFYARPVEILGGQFVRGLKVERTEVLDGRSVGSGEFRELECCAVIAAIGYRGAQLGGVPFDERLGIVVNQNGRIDDGLYAVGWIGRGPVGVIGTNKPDGDTVAAQIAADGGDPQKPGRDELELYLKERGRRWVSFADWQLIDRLEVQRAPDGAPRCKFTSAEEMLAALEQEMREAS